jgi:hypothetical protein
MDQSELIQLIKTEIRDPIQEDVKELRLLITGNGDVGVCERVRVLEARSKAARGFFYVAGMGLVVKIGYDVWQWLTAAGGG